MKKLILLTILFNISCNGITQQKRDTGSEKYDEAYRFIGSYGDSLKFKPRKKVYQTYIKIGQDTVLLSTQEYQFFDKEKDTIINNSYQEQKKLSLSDSVFMVQYSGEFFLINNNNTKYSLIDKIKVEYETFYDDLGEAHETYFPASEIENLKNNEYIVTYSYEGGFKIGVFEINEKGIAKKFLSKGCLFYDEWSNFTFYEIKNGEVFINYLIDPEGEATGQIELEYENGGYSLNKDQCRE